MRDVTMYRRNDGSVDYIPWANRDNPTNAEINPPEAKYIVYTVFPHNTVDGLKNMTKDKVDAFLNSYIPK